ncbi:MAG: hypothetical protein J6Y97_15040 [Prevotella sp.]|nr:hypothetical protein [Prevotella sp.]
MPRRCQPVNHTVPNVSRSSPPFKREVEPLWRAGPTTLPAGREHGRPLWLQTPRSSSHDGQGMNALPSLHRISGGQSCGRR